MPAIVRSKNIGQRWSTQQSSPFAMDVEYVPAGTGAAQHHLGVESATGTMEEECHNGDDADGPTTISRRMWASSLISAFPSFLFGYCISALNTALVTGEGGSPKMCFTGDDATCPRGSALRDLYLPTGQQEVATSLLIAGAWLGSMLASRPSDALGRRKTLLLNTSLFIVGGTMCAMATRPSALFVGRFIGGMGVGCGSGVVPVLLSEISSPSTRGAVGSLHQLMINIGILSSGLLGYAFVQDVEHGWRYVQGFMAVPALAQIALAAFVPESPRWLVKHGRAGEARALLRKLWGGGGRDAAVHRAIEQEVAGMEGGKDDDRKGSASWGEVWVYRSPVLVGVAVMLLQAFTGINTVIFYSTTIFELAGVEDEVLATVAVGLSLVVMTSVSGILVDKAGRRGLLLTGTAIMAVALGSLSIALFRLNTSPRFQGWLAVLATLLFIAGFSLGMGAVGWILLAEIVPSRIRAQAFSIFTAVNWGSNFFVGLFTLTAIDAMGAWLLPSSTSGSSSSAAQTGTSPSVKDQQKAGVAGLYAVFAAMSVLAVVFLFFFVRETMGKSLEELEGGGAGGGGSAVADRGFLRVKDGGGLLEEEDEDEASDSLLGVGGETLEVDRENPRRVAL